MLGKIKEIIEKIENSSAPLHYFALSFLFIVILRSFLESLSDTDIWGTIKPLVIIHYISFYVTLAALLIALFYFVTKVDLNKIYKIILSGFVILVSVPLSDLIISGGKGYDIAYLLPEIHGNLLSRFLTFFGEFYISGMGITPGIRIEIILVLLGSFAYFWLKKVGWIKNIIATFLVYLLIFLYLSFPFIAKSILELINLDYKYSPTLMFRFSLLIFLLVSVLAAYAVNRINFKLILKDIRPFRVLHFESMFFIGVLFALKNYNFTLTTDNLFCFIFIPIAIVSAWIFSVITNNIQDVETDKISNKERPLIKESMDPVFYNRIAWLFFFLALIYAGFINFTAFFVILLFIGNYFLYSMPPFRLKRVPFFSKIFISLNSLILLMLGFVLISGISIENIPISNSLFFLILIMLTAVINFIDIKDYEGDKKEGIKTLPVLMGLKRSKILISIFFAIAYLFVCFLTKDLSTLIIFFVLGCLQVYLINRKNYNEKYIFIIYLSSVLYLITQYLLP